MVVVVGTVGVVAVVVGGDDVVAVGGAVHLLDLINWHH